MNNNINELIAEFPKDKQSEILEYLKNSQTFGNPLLEEFFIREHASILQLQKHEDLRKKFQLDLDNWIEGLEPKLQEQAFEFFKSIEDHVSVQVNNLVVANETMAEALDRAVETAKAEIEASRLSQEKKLAETFELERRKVQKMFIETMNEKLNPHVEAAFKNSSDKFTAKAIIRDVAIVLGGLCLFFGLKFFF